VHLEDNEFAVQRAVVDDHDSTAAGEFVRGAAGMTVVIERLLEFKPAKTEGVVVWPGYEPAIDLPGRRREAIRDDIGVRANEFALVYCGNVHEANFDEVASLYEAVSLLRAGGAQIVLVRTGWTHVTKRLPALERAGLRDLGWISRRRIPELLVAADILVQPGSPGPFNDYRFPSKLPEFLASGRPVVLPRTNIGLCLQDGVDALLLDRGDAGEILEKVSLLVGDVELRTRLGERGRAFAVRELQWSKNVPEVARLYEAVH
jgi:glycosyltransferase involved in cell wall biosynthesis